MCAHALVSGGQGCTKSNICFEICKKSLRLPAAQKGTERGSTWSSGPQQREREECVYTGGENAGKVK